MSAAIGSSSSLFAQASSVRGRALGVTGLALAILAMAAAAFYVAANPALSHHLLSWQINVMVLGGLGLTVMAVPLFVYVGQLISPHKVVRAVANGEDGRHVDVAALQEGLRGKGPALLASKARATSTFNADLKLAQLDEVAAVCNGEKTDGVIFHRGGKKLVFELPTSCPGKIFKVSNKQSNEPFAQEYCRLVEEAQALREEKGLFLLQIPQAHYCTINDVAVIIEERVPNVVGNFNFQKGLWNWVRQNAELRAYHEELTRQLIIFTMEFGFQDVKYNNTPLSPEGYVVLCDLDRKGAEKGLTWGCAPRRGGALHYLRADQLDGVTTSLGAAQIGVIRGRLQRREAREERFRRWTPKLDARFTRVNNPDPWIGGRMVNKDYFWWQLISLKREGVIFRYQWKRGKFIVHF